MRKKEEIKALQDRLVQLLPVVEAELLQIPGVVGVGIGFKEIGGELTNEVSFRVYVREKKPENLVPPSERIPDTIHGVKTDVLVIQETETLVDDSRYRPVKGGIQIGNGSGRVGTLGCLAKRNAGGAWVILSNHHVMLAGGKALTDQVKIGQPDYSSCCCCACGEIGEVVNAAIGGLVDCAIATLNSDASFVNEIANIGPVKGKATAILGETVRKIGRTTGLTSGEVVDINYPTISSLGNNFTSQIKINPSSGTAKFSDRGDSGSAIVNSDDKVVGLLWGGSSGHGVASHAANIESAMAITIQATSGIGASVTVDLAPSNGNGHAPLKYPELVAATGWDWVDHHLAIALVESHQAEVIRLINHSRPVMVTWQRKQGPAYVAAFARSRRELDYLVPEIINGVSLTNLLMSMYVVLEENGSESLRQDLKRYGLEAIERLRTCNSFASLGRQLQAFGLLAVEPAREFAPPE
jgi:hypothetical protein